MLDRRAFLKHTLAAGAVMLLPGCSDAEALSNDVLMNHVGFAPAAAKIGLIPGERDDDVIIVHRETRKQAWQGKAAVVRGDMGTFGRFDCSSTQESGNYEVQIGGKAVAQFRVDPRVYDDALAKGIGYFAKQRCGDSSTGYNAPCHLDDGQIDGKHRDVTGGWHDACDLRKWVDATLYGMIGLTRLLETPAPDRSRDAKIIEELKWGNQYFLKMQEPVGYLMNYCGGDTGNHFTDNRSGTQDDRAIHTEACDLTAQFNFVMVEATMAHILEHADPPEAKRCLQASRRCFKWCLDNREPKAALSLAAGTMAAMRLHEAGGDEASLTAGVEFADRLLGLQVKKSSEPSLAGFFLAKADSSEPLRDIQHGNLPLLAVCDLLHRIPNHPQAARWRDALQLHLQHLHFMSTRSAFETIPYGLYTQENPGGGRRVGEYAYRWFMKPRGEYSAADWWVGINAHLASQGVGLSRAARLLSDAHSARLAQRQLDWILGVNPFNASTISQVGRNQPRLYRPGGFRPPTPQIAGGVMNGIGGTPEDHPTLSPGSYHTCEYWTPMVAYTLWLMAEQSVHAASLTHP